MLDWIFEGIVNWISSIVSQMMDAVSGLFLQTLGTDMTAMEEYFPFVAKDFTVMQYTAWAILFLTRQLSAQIHSARLSFASGEDMERLLGASPGSASVLGLMNDTEGAVRLLVDEELLAQPYLCCHPCHNTVSLRLPAKAVWETFLTETKHGLTPVRLTEEET